MSVDVLLTGVMAVVTRVRQATSMSRPAKSKPRQETRKETKPDNTELQTTNRYEEQEQPEETYEGEAYLEPVTAAQEEAGLEVYSELAEADVNYVVDE